jgi:hypothetical protein
MKFSFAGRDLTILSPENTAAFFLDKQAAKTNIPSP